MSWYDRALTAERERDEARQQVAALEHRYEFDVSIPMDEQREHIGRLEQQVAALREALGDVDSYLADPSGHPLDCINFARKVIRTALAATEDGTADERRRHRPQSAEEANSGAEDWLAPDGAA